MNYLKYGTGASSRFDEAKDKARPLTPRSERPRRTWGSLAVSLQTVGGLCSEPRCVKKENHAGRCWPAPTE